MISICLGEPYVAEIGGEGGERGEMMDRARSPKFGLGSRDTIVRLCTPTSPIAIKHFDPAYDQEP